MKTITIDGIEYDLVKRECAVKEPEPLICTLDGYMYFLGPEADEPMDWKQACEWAAAQGEGYEPPNRLVLLACYSNPEIRGRFKADSWYWSSTEFNSSGAWRQGFGDGYQASGTKYYNYYVRAVRKVAVGV